MKVFAERKHIELKDLSKHPFEDSLSHFDNVEELIGIVDTRNSIKICL